MDWLSFLGHGYNEQSKAIILDIAFNELRLEKVFAGAKLSNKRSIRAQQKLGYVTYDVGSKYPDELEKIEQQTGEKCLLNVIDKEDFNKKFNYKTALN